MTETLNELIEKWKERLARRRGALPTVAPDIAAYHHGGSEMLDSCIDDALSALAGIARPAQETYRDICVRYHNALVGYGRAGAVDLQAIEDADNAFIALDEAEAARPTRDGGTND